MNATNYKMHVSYYVSDIQSTINFYDKLFDQAANKVKVDYAKYELNNPGLVISFIENKDRVSSEFGHLGIRVNTDEELKAKQHSLEESGVLMREEMNTECCYAIQNKFWVADPDGYQWEVYQFIEDSANIKNQDASCCTPQTMDSSGINILGQNCC